MTSVVLSIGSNLGDRQAHLRSVVDGLGDAVRAVSAVYETEAWGGVEQGAFLNAVVVADEPGPFPDQLKLTQHDPDPVAVERRGPVRPDGRGKPGLDSPRLRVLQEDQDRRGHEQSPV